MCLAVPMKIESIANDAAVVNVGGTRQNVNIAFLDDVAEGDYVLVHAGFAINKIDEGEAKETIRLLNQLAGFSLRDAQG